MGQVNAAAFFAYARARYQAKINKELGLPKPYSPDPILQQFRFCNVHREDDTVTKWIREHITYESYGEELLGAMVIARWFNRVPTLERIYGAAGQETDLFAGWSIDFEAWAEEMSHRLADVKPLVTGAYMIKTPAKMNKLQGILWCLKRFLPNAIYHQKIMEQEGYTLEDATSVLMQFPYLGPFMAYEVVTDLRFTPVLENAPDILTWANPGPGCARGLSRVLGEHKDYFNRHSTAHIKMMMTEMQALLVLSNDPEFWPQHWPHWEMREVEHTLCEFDKYQRVLLGEGTPKQRYNGEKE